MIRSVVTALALVALAGSNSFAHKLWVLPSQTQFSGDDAWVTVDACASNDLFYFNHIPLPLENLSLVGPDGKRLEAVHKAQGKYRSVFDLELTQDGTYRIALLTNFVFAHWQENGESVRWRGTIANLASDVPREAEGLQISESLGRIETFVTKNAPTTKSTESTGDGIELIPVTHPNDLYVGEKATFRMLVGGEPRAGLEVSVVRGGTRYRNSLDEIKLTTNSAGEISVTWPVPGMYWLSTSAQDDKTSIAGAKVRYLAYSATLEVLPE